VAESGVGKEVDLEILRKGKRETVKVTLGRLEEGEEESKQASKPQGENKDQDQDQTPLASAELMGMTIKELDEAGRSQFSLPEEVAGVLVTEVKPNSVAAEQGIQPGDVIVEIALRSVSSPQEVLDQVEELKQQGRKNALLMLSSKSGELRFVTLRMS